MFPANASGLNLLDLLSGATTSGSRLTEVMLRSEERLYEAVREFIRSSYEIELELDGIVALRPKDTKNGSTRGINL